LATTFGYHAFELLKAGDFNKLVVMQGNELSAVPIKEVANKVRTVPLDHRLIRAARAVGTSFGD
jgi:6-phosphofructokinase 1